MAPTTTFTVPSLTELMEAGAHFGHKRHRSTPQVRKYVFTIRDRVLVIDLEATQRQLAAAAQFLSEQVRSRALMLFVGTKRQASGPIRALADRLEQPFVTERWLGGTLTNFETIQARLKRLRELEGIAGSDSFETTLSKKDRVLVRRQIARLERTLGGLRRLTRIPDVLVILDTNEEANALREARSLGVPIVGLVDTNANPDHVTYPIVGNDDSAKTIALVLGTLEQAMLAARVSAGEVEVKGKVPTVAEAAEQIEVAPTPKKTAARTVAKRVTSAATAATRAMKSVRTPKKRSVSATKTSPKTTE
jgi:small subunit ribosomal protein S2